MDARLHFLAQGAGVCAIEILESNKSLTTKNTKPTKRGQNHLPTMTRSPTLPQAKRIIGRVNFHYFGGKLRAVCEQPKKVFDKVSFSMLNIHE
jgi:hypothetical protein